MILIAKKLDKPHIFKMGCIWVAVEEFTYFENGKMFTPIASAFTLEELYEELKPSLFTRIKKWIRRLI